MNAAAITEAELLDGRARLLRRLEAWVERVWDFRRAEEPRLLLGAVPPAPRDLERHRALLTDLLGAGELLLLSLRSHEGIDRAWPGLRSDEVEAAVTELRSDLAMWHGDMSAERRTKILREVFGIRSAAGGEPG